MTNLVDITIRASDLTGPGFASAMAKVEVLKKAVKDIGGINLGVNANIDSQLSALKSKLAAHGIADLIDVNLNQGQIDQQLLLLKRKIGQAKINDLLDFNVDTTSVTSKLTDLENKIADTSVPLKIVGDVSGLNLPKLGPTQNVNIGGVIAPAFIQGMQTAAADLAAVKTQADAAAGASGGGGGGLFGLAAAAAAAGGGFNAFNSRFKVTNAGWATAIGGVALWHVALDAALEALIAVGLASAAAAIGIAAMTPAAQDVVLHLKAIQTVNSALGSQIPPLTGQFSNLAQAMAPQVIEAYGGALNLASGKTGVFADVAGKVVNLFDTWIAKLDIWAQSQNGMGKLLQSGVGFLSQFGHIAGEVLFAINNLVKADPGTAHFLLDLIGGLGKVLDIVTSLPTPILLTGLALHSMYVWGSVLGTALNNLIKYFGGLGKMMIGLPTNPFFWVAAAAAGIAYLGYEMSQTTKAAKDFIGGLETQLSNTPDQQLFSGITDSIGALNSKIKTTLPQIDEAWGAFNRATTGAGKDFERTLHDIPESLASWSQMGKTFKDLGGTIGNLGKAAADFFPNLILNRQTVNSITAYRQEIVKLSGDQGNLFATFGKLISQGYGVAQSLALMDLAGVKYNDSAKVMQEKVANLITGYQNMSVQGGILSNSVNAVTFSTLQQNSQVQQLAQGWTDFLKLITGGESAFVTFQQQMQGIAAAAGNASTQLNISNGKVSLSTKGVGAAAAGAAASINGLNNSSLQLRSSFTQGITDAGNLFNSLMSLASASGLGAKGTDMLTQSTKDMIAQLLPLAKGSQAATTELYALAQQGGYQGANSFQALSKWVLTASGSMTTAKDPAKQLDGIVSTLTKDAGNLTTDVQNLSTALGTTLNAAMATAIFQASGGQKAFDNFATAILNTHSTAGQLQTAANSLGNELITVLGNASQAKNEFYALAIDGLHQTKQQADALWQSFAKEKLTEAANKAGETKTQFETLATQLGWTKTAADKLWTSLHKVAQGSPYNANVDVHGSGSGTITFAEQNIKNAQTGYLEFHAAGGRIAQGTTGTADDVPVMASRDEWVIRASSANQYGPAAMDAVNKGTATIGYASGGRIGDLGTPVSWMSGREVSAAQRMESAMAAAMIADMKAKVAAAAAAAAAAGSPGPGGGAPAANAALARRLHPDWGSGNNWAMWNYIAMAESGWNQFARNPSSGAYGIPQALPPGKMGAAANPPQSNPTAQINWMYNYIQGGHSYGAGLAAAYNNERNNHWYGSGGATSGGWIGVGEHGRELIKVPGGSTVIPHGQSEQMIAGGAGGGVALVQLEISSGGQSDFEKFMSTWIKNYVRVKGGGQVQKAFGRT